MLNCYIVYMGSCRNPGQALNFLPPVTFTQGKEKVEEATQEMTQQR